MRFVAPLKNGENNIIKMLETLQSAWLYSFSALLNIVLLGGDASFFRLLTEVEDGEPTETRLKLLNGIPVSDFLLVGDKDLSDLDDFVGFSGDIDLLDLLVLVDLSGEVCLLSRFFRSPTFFPFLSE